MPLNYLYLLMSLKNCYHQTIKALPEQAYLNNPTTSNKKIIAKYPWS